MRKTLKRLKHITPTISNIDSIRIKENELEEMLKNEEIWAQRAKAKWLVHGD